MSYLGLGLLSAATLAFEITLMRVFSVAQFYHFAFMIVSLALLGFGASGTALTFFPQVVEQALWGKLAISAWGFALTAIGSYALTNVVPFDSFRVARDWRQGSILALHYVALSIPFLCSGVAVGLLLSSRTHRVARSYAANLTGSAIGCLLAVVTPSWVGEEGTILFSVALGIAATVVFAFPLVFRSHGIERAKFALLQAAQVGAVVALAAVVRQPPAFLQVRMSPYKSLSYLLLYPDAEVLFRRANGFSRVDVVRSDSIRSLPGSGFRCAADLPTQLGLTVDGEDMSPISQVEVGLAPLPFTDCLLTALPYRLRPEASALVLDPRGGFDLLVALSEGAQTVTAVEPNPLIVRAVREQGAWAGALLEDPRVDVVEEMGRAYVRRTGRRYDVVQLALTSSQRPVMSGAYSLAEDYRYTIEAFTDYMSVLEDAGLLVITRWLQVPPSESVRAFALAVEAIERNGGSPRLSLVALRSYQQMLILARQGSFTARELAAIRRFAATRAFDLVYLPDLRPEEVNRHNVLDEPVYSQACLALVSAEDREAWYRTRPFNVKPPEDDWPFFGHYFKWRQAPDVLAMAGHIWQPFGGMGYFVLLALLLLAILAAGVLIVAPLALRRRSVQQQGQPVAVVLAYFALLGLGYMAIEVPLLQRFILFLAHPAYAIAVVLFALLLFSGIGSVLSHRVRLDVVLAILPLLTVAYALGLPSLFRLVLSAPLGIRLAVAVMALAPPGMLMGMPFPKGLGLLERRAPMLVVWAWGANGAVSVVASILAALIAFDLGFTPVLVGGALCYAGAWVMARILGRTPAARAHR
jgi:spermidine synthase